MVRHVSLIDVEDFAYGSQNTENCIDYYIVLTPDYCDFYVDSMLARQDIMSDSESVCFNYVMRGQSNAKCEPDISLFDTCNSTFRNITEWPPQLSMGLTGYIQFGMSFAFSECNRTSGTKIFESCQGHLKHFY